MFFVDKRHWPEFGFVTIFFVDKRHWPTLVLLQCFYGSVLSCSGGSIFCNVWLFWRLIFSVVSLFFSLQMFVSDHGWRCLLLSVKPDLGELFRHYWSLRRILQRRARRKILKFIECDFSGVRSMPPFPVSLWLLIFLRFIRVLAHMPL